MPGVLGLLMMRETRGRRLPSPWPSGGWTRTASVLAVEMEPRGSWLSSRQSRTYVVKLG